MSLCELFPNSYVDKFMEEQSDRDNFQGSLSREQFKGAVTRKLKLLNSVSVRRGTRATLVVSVLEVTLKISPGADILLSE